MSFASEHGRHHSISQRDLVDLCTRRNKILMWLVSLPWNCVARESESTFSARDIFQVSISNLKKRKNHYYVGYLLRKQIMNLQFKMHGPNFKFRFYSIHLNPNHVYLIHFAQNDGNPISHILDSIFDHYDYFLSN